MFYLKSFFYFLLFHFNLATPQLNLYNTDGVSEIYHELQHDCLRLVSPTTPSNNHRKIISYCLSELPSKFHIKNNSIVPKFTFDELSNRNVTSEELYLWSAPIDLIERYHLYLDQISTFNYSSLSTDVFHNCTMPRFGPECQYEIVYNYSDDSSLYEFIRDIYQTYEYKPKTLTCYEHLQCYRGPSPMCLDWSEICDGRIDCLDGGFDEKHCWELEINECEENEFRCTNGQCVPKEFYLIGTKVSLCLDRSDRVEMEQFSMVNCEESEPLFGCEDVICAYTFMTSSCILERRDLLLKAMFSIQDNLVSKKCWLAIECILNLPGSEMEFCDEFCMEDKCIQIIEHDCPDMFYFPNVPFFFGHIYFAYKKNSIPDLLNSARQLPYMCYNDSRYNDYFRNSPMILFKNTTCFLLPLGKHFPIWGLSWFFLYDRYLSVIYEELKFYSPTMNLTGSLCNKTNMYQCANSSKCISIYRVEDSIADCPDGSDENIVVINNNTDIYKIMEKTHFKCEATGKYIPHFLVNNYLCDCGYMDEQWCEDEHLEMNIVRRNISFQTICDKFVELWPVLIDNQNETDETECQQWECNNMYTRCDGHWNCRNGEDEAGCISSSTLTCSSQHHLCVSPYSNELMCLSLQKVNDGVIDCLGATDEPLLCQPEMDNIRDDQGILYFEYRNMFHCICNNSQQCFVRDQLCFEENDCDNDDYQQFCRKHSESLRYGSVCWDLSLPFISDAEKFICNYVSMWRKKYTQIHFSINELIQSSEDEKEQEEIFPVLPPIDMLAPDQFRCHRGLNLYVWLDNKTNLPTNTCLCPSTYYGNQCQYQNQRIALTIQFHAFSDSWKTLFTVIISLIDDSDQRIIHSYEQLTYLSMRDCKTKFSFYLLYSTRPKSEINQHAIHIDFYEKISLTYRGSVLLPIKFPFLPVHRLPIIVDIPRSDNKTQNCYNVKCINGQCIKYWNNSQDLTFCQCKEGWSGRYCTIKHTCTCAPDSLCIGISANNRSICVCKQNKFGPRCFLTNEICQNNDNSTCQNGGQCIFNDGYLISNRTFTCICPKGYSGDQCEIVENKLILSFNKNIVLSESLFIHFIEVFKRKEPVRSTAFHSILLRQDTQIIRWSHPFHLAFIEFADKTYYLTVYQTISNQSEIINKTIQPSDRCPNITEIFNQTFLQWHLLRRIKYYHLPCQNQSLNLSCFHDEVHFCLCYTFGEKRLANCFNFDHNMKFDCFGKSECENDGECFQDKPDCPHQSICVCKPCFYGRRCQFSTSGFGLSLDAIIGYHILPNININHQSPIIKFTLSLTIIFILAGLINGILCMITFKNKSVREIGCGLYLFGSSFTTLIITIIFGLKFFILLLAQITTISNRSFLSFQCYSIDFILRCFLYMDQWLNAFVAIERATTVFKGVGFDKKKSKQIAKILITILSIVIIGSCIHEPIYRRLIDEEYNDDDGNKMKRIWCTISYSPSLQIYNSAIHIFHFFGPFIINLISSMILITKKSRQQANLHTQQSYRNILREHIKEHKNLLTAPIILVILAIPRLIIVFVSKCMKSSNDAWLFLIGYFISFIPPMLTFIIFIVPSKFYIKELHKTIQQYRNNIQRNFNLISH